MEERIWAELERQSLGSDSRISWRRLGNVFVAEVGACTLALWQTIHWRLWIVPEWCTDLAIYHTSVGDKLAHLHAILGPILRKTTAERLFERLSALPTFETPRSLDPRLVEALQALEALQRKT